jgi:hypothetical protein
MTETEQPDAPEIEIAHPLGLAWEHMKSALFPFNFKAWITLGFLSWLAVLGIGSFNLPKIPFRSGARNIPFPKYFEWIEGMNSYMPILIPVGIALAIVVSVVLAYLRSRATFVYLDNVYKRTANVVEPWHRTRDLAHSFFIWRMCLTFLQVCAAAAAGMIFYMTMRDMAGHEQMTPQMLPEMLLKIVFPMLIMMPILLIIGVANWVLGSLLAPVMYMGNLKGQAAWTLLGNMFKRRPGAFFLFFLMNIALGLMMIPIVLIVSLCICIVGALPVIHQTIVQPFLYWIRAYPFFFFAQFGPELVAPVGVHYEAPLPGQVSTAPEPPPHAGPPPRVAVCPHCGQQHAIPDGQPGTYACVRCGGNFEVT